MGGSLYRHFSWLFQGCGICSLPNIRAIIYLKTSLKYGSRSLKNINFDGSLIQIWASISQEVSKLLSEGREGGVLIPFPRKLFFFKSQLKSHNPSLRCSNWNPIPIFLLFIFHESQSQCTKSHFPASKKGKSQLPFYPFATLLSRSTGDNYRLNKLSSNRLPSGLGLSQLFNGLSSLHVPVTQS